MTRQQRRAQVRQQRKVASKRQAPPTPTANEFEAMVIADPVRALVTFCSVRDMQRDSG